MKRRRRLARVVGRRRCSWCALTLPWWRWSTWCGACAAHGTGMAASSPCPAGSRVDEADLHAVAALLAASYEPDHPAVGRHDLAAARRLLTGRTH
ncbi:hypothetical protein ACFCZ3_19900 [Cellulosimicrobium cellulans]|uniref:hypothetical protein n=1 Tax=Cellulosimicrobium cellulans TaxID=1710 RepID=UPI0035DD4DBC